MKLKKFTKPEEYVKYWHNGEDIDVPEYVYREDDMRAAWVSNVANIDTPRGLSEEDYKKALVRIIETAAEYNMNALVFQVRPTNDAYYPSKLNPWSRFITGVEGQDPGFDVLQFVIDEANKHGIRIHAWMNPYRVGMKPIDEFGSKEAYLETLHENNWARLHPEHTILDGLNKVILSPSHPEVIQFVTDTIMEVVNNYDVDGVHIDDYFYPYAKISDEAELEDYLKYRESENQSMDDFRRMNVDKMIKSISDAMKNSLNKKGNKIEFGISPFAIYRSHISIDPETGWEKGSYHSKGVLQCYLGLYSDIYRWMKEGWIDYVVPQLYFPFERPDVTYHDLTMWWSNIAKETNTKLYTGNAIYQMGAQDKVEWANPDEIKNQLSFNSQFENIKGSVFFTFKDFFKGENEIKNAALDTIKELWCKQK
jgi:uncharacterized lipoprotein YddW (UPF0748 family)